MKIFLIANFIYYSSSNQLPTTYAMPQDHNPTTADVKTAILLFPGPCFTYRAFRQAALRFVCGTAKVEFMNAIEQLKSQLGSVVSLRVARSPQPTTVFRKQNPAVFPVWPCPHLCLASNFANKFALPMHKSITKNIRDFLLQRQVITQGQYDS